MTRNIHPALLGALLASTAAPFEHPTHVVKPGATLRGRRPRNVLAAAPIDPVAQEKYRARFRDKLARRRARWLACGGRP